MVRNQYVTVCAQDAAELTALARTGREIADETGCMLRVMLLAGWQGQDTDSAALLEDVFACAKRMDAEMNVYYTDRPIDRLMKDRSECLVMRSGNGMAGEIRRRMPGRRLVVLD